MFRERDALDIAFMVGLILLVFSFALFLLAGAYVFYTGC